MPPPSTHSLTHSEDYHMVATYICYKTLGCARHREQETTTKSSREKKKAVKHERHKAQGLTDLYLTAVPSERSTAVTCGQYSSRYVSATGCEEEETTTRRPKEKKKRKKKTQTTRNSLTGLPQQDNPSMREEIRFSPPLTPASPLAPLLPACLPACLLAFQIRDAISLNTSVCS